MYPSYRSIVSKKTTFPSLNYNRPYTVVKPVSKDFQGRKITSSELVIEKPSDRYKGLHGVDFALENQVAVGFNGQLSMMSYNQSEIEMQLQKALANG